MYELINLLKTDPNLANAVAAVASCFTALLALIVSVWALWLQRRHNRLSVRPMPEVTVADYENSLRVKLRNNGVGPMIVHSMRVSKGVEIKDSVIEWMPLLPRNRPWTHFSLALENRTLQQDGSITLLELTEGQAEESFFQCRDIVRKELSKLEVEVIYTDVYQSKLPNYKKSLAWFGRHTGGA